MLRSIVSRRSSNPWISTVYSRTDDVTPMILTAESVLKFLVGLDTSAVD
jgi:hypothetical protein